MALREIPSDRDAVHEDSRGTRRPSAPSRAVTGLARIHSAVSVAGLALDLVLAHKVADEDLSAAVHTVRLVEIVWDVDVGPALGAFRRNQPYFSHGKP